MFSIQEWLIGSWHWWVPKSLMVWSRVFHTRFKKVLVVRKGAIQCIEVWSFWDSMQLIEVVKKPFMPLPLREECMIHALTVYKEYDEEANETYAYAYQFPKDDALIQQVNELLPDWVSLHQQWKFVQVINQTSHNVSWEALIACIKMNGKRWVKSFLYWLSLLYWTWSWEWRSMEIRLPMWWSFTQLWDAFERLAWRLSQQLYAVEWKVVDGPLWQWRHCIIDDWTILEQFALWQWVEWPLPWRERAIWYHQKLLDYLKIEHTPGSLMQDITKATLKLWKK